MVDCKVSDSQVRKYTSLVHDECETWCVKDN